jgi:hypothetical protein
MQGISFAMADTSAQGMVNALSGTSRPATQSGYPNFFPAAQRDFAARMLWSVTPRYADANHAPRVRIDGPLELVVYAGQSVRLAGTVADPDGHAVVLKWWQFMLPDTRSTVEVATPANPQTRIAIPKDAKPGEAYHIILEATDNGSPALTAYQRVIMTVKGR